MKKTMNMTTSRVSRSRPSPPRPRRRSSRRSRRRPRPARRRASRCPRRRTITLDNGLAVTLVQYGTVPKVTVNLGSPDRQRRREGRTRSGSPTSSARCSPKARRRAPRSQIAEDAARMGGALDITVGENRIDIGGDVLSEFAPEMVALVADVARNPKFPESELARLKADKARELSIAKSQPQPLAQEKFRAVLYGDHPYGRLFPTEAMLQGYTIAQVKRLLRPQLRRRALAPLRRRPFRPGGRRGRDPQGVRRLEEGAGAQHDEAVAEERARRLPHRPARRPAVHDQHRHAGDRSLESGLGPALRDERAARRLVRVAHHLEHPRAEGLHVLAAGPALQPLPRRLLGRDRRRHDERRPARRSRRSSARSTGCRPSRPRRRSSRPSRTTARASSCSRTPRGRGIIGQLEFVDLHGLPADYLNGYVGRIYAVTPAQVQQMAQEVPPGRQGDDRHRRRPEGHRRAGQGVRAGEVTRARAVARGHPER